MRTASSAGTPLARVGFALRATHLEGSEEAWASLRGDIEAVRSQLNAHDRDVFDLVVAVRGLNSNGRAEWSEAVRLCNALRWPRCDRAALEALQQRSRP